MQAATARAKVNDREMPDCAADALWELFCKRLLSAVRDCNCTAGETMWTISTESQRVEIRSTTRPLARLELLFDAARARLCCTFGTSPKARWSFRLLPHENSVRRGSRMYSVDDTVNSILDRLVTIAARRYGNDGGCEPAKSRRHEPK
ncbi:MAG TPA: hypothetical protein VKV17_10765 [Bryobacteraceae bacterium]|nr:hypothetical protein [Bryobacteraceae bacterium]